MLPFPSAVRAPRCNLASRNDPPDVAHPATPKVGLPELSILGHFAKNTGMNTAAYWISDQEKVTGPFTEGQITSMWRCGRITADAQLRESEHQPWNSAREVILRWKKLRLAAIIARAGLGLSLLVLLRLAIVEWHNDVDNQPARLAARKTLIVDWISSNLADQKARLLTYGPVQRELLKDQPWLDVLVADDVATGKAPACAVYRFTFDAEDHITGATKRP
jgi:hypothetical protein